jgi:hypothetical protein
MGSLLYRMMGAAVLDGTMYEGIEADRRAGPQAFAVVVLASLAAGIGASGPEGLRPSTLMIVAAVALAAWLAWAGLILQIGTRFLPGRATVTNLGELLRTIGFAASPGLLLAFGLIVPRIYVFAAVGIWMIAAMIVALRQALDYHSTARAAAAALAALGVIAALALGMAVLFGPDLS